MQCGFSADLYRMQRKFCALRQKRLEERTKTADKNCEKCRHRFEKGMRMAAVPRKIATRAGKMNCIPGDVGRRRARQGKGLKKTIFQVEKNHFS